MRVKVLGSAAGGGFPQWNCGCSNCNRLRGGVLKGRARTQTQVAVSTTGSTWLLLNASPDLRQQLIGDREFAPRGVVRSTPISGIILTSAEVDCVLGLLHLREFQPLRVYSTPSVRRALTEENTLFRALARSNPPIRWEDLPLDRPTPILEQNTPGGKMNVSCQAVPLGGSFPDYVSDHLRQSLRAEEAVVSLQLMQNEKKFFYAPNLPGRGENWKQCTAASDLALLDGTFWTDDELSKVLGNGRTARQMGHLPLSGADGLLEHLQDVQNTRRVLIHLNNTNPALDEESGASRSLRDSGWEIAYDGMEFEL
jgi:pyrroloquinoline quinone biosynthesis protein B